MSTKPDLYPLTFEPIYKEKVWGGRSFETLGRTLPGDATTGIGESWELADLATTSASGGGGNAEYSVVANGPLKGQSIRELMQQYGEALLGQGVKPADDGGFPLLIKFLDAKENLSVQVHPSPEYAAAHKDAYLKSEAWYIIDHEPGAVIYKGLAPGVTPEMLRDALETNTDEAVVPLLNAIPAKNGDCHYLPSGTLHALGAGVLVAEVQTPSDTTYRVYDWGRTDRELHIEQAMACIDFDGMTNTVSLDFAMHWLNHTPKQEGCFFEQAVAACDYFIIKELSCTSDLEFKWMSSSYQPFYDFSPILIPLAGHAEFVLSDGSAIDLIPGKTLYVPPLSRGLETVKVTEGTRWLDVYPAGAR